MRRFIESHSPRTIALKAIFPYLLLGILWILFSDFIVFSLVDDVARLERISTLKGWAFILLSAGMLFVLIEQLALRGEEEVTIYRESLEELLRIRTRELEISQAQLAEKLAAEKALTESEEQLRGLAHHQESMIEEERTRIAREIHDELGQQLTVLKMDLAWLRNKIPPDMPLVWERIRLLLRMVDETHGVVERIIQELRPQILDDLGLVPAIEWLAEEFQHRTGMSIEVRVRPEEIRVGKETGTALFRIAQEALTNVARHAGGTRARITLRAYRSACFLQIRDDGKGIGPEGDRRPGSHGLAGIAERVRNMGGTMRIRRGRAGGTSLGVLVPATEPVSGREIE